MGFFLGIFPRDFSTIQISSFTLDIYLIAASISAIFGGKIQISTNKQNETLWMISNLFFGDNFGRLFSMYHFNIDIEHY